MSSLRASAFKGGNHAALGSNVFTNQNQGGGSSKAGFPYQVGRNSWVSVKLGVDPSSRTSTGCASLKCLQFTVNPRVSESRNIATSVAGNRYFHIPGLNK